MAVDVMKPVRADKLLCDLGCGTRKEVKKLILSGALRINGEPVRKPEYKISPDCDMISLNDKPVSFDEFEYWVLNKPAGILSATTDPHQKTVIDYMGLKRKNMSPCGRLDKDTEGLLIITDDGELNHRLISPGSCVEKVYEVSYSGMLPPDAEERFRTGLVLEDGTKCRPAGFQNAGPLKADGLSGLSRAVVVLHEGKYHEVKRMFEVLGCKVVKLKRTGMGPLNLSDLKTGPGEFRKLRADEIRKLKEI
jgi:16S rRNA pseudouridine516 synthase